MDWLRPWEPLDEGRAAGLEAELRREVRPGHPLHGRILRALGARCDCDDVLFALDDGRLAVVHLTWAGGRERPPWPEAALFADLDDWATRGMATDHAAGRAAEGPPEDP